MSLYLFQQVSYRSRGLQINPNLYESGKVCLSLLNTWVGTGCENWNPANSTMLQVLVSIQALVLNAKPFFNEAGHAMSANSPLGEKLSMTYNEKTFLLSCRTMQYSSESTKGKMYALFVFFLAMFLSIYLSLFSF